jgi:peptide/nickel transport system permease protein
MRHAGVCASPPVVVTPNLIGVTLVVFLMMRFIPGDPVTNMMGEMFSQEDADRLRKELGLDKPLLVQYGKWLGLLLRGDWGNSLFTHQPVLTDILYRLPVSLELLVLSTIVSLLIALPAGTIAAVRPNTWKDYSAMVVAMAGVSIPEFFLGVMLFLLFGLVLGWLPVSGYVPLLENPWGNLIHMVLPVIALGLPRAALLTRLVRASLLEVLKMEYVTTARAKGLGEQFVILKHALKNALIPTVTVIGLQVGFLIGGAIVIETVFAVPGIGSFGIDAIIKRDYPQVQAFVLVGALVFVLANLVVDLLYVVIDPRIQYNVGDR